MNTEILENAEQGGDYLTMEIIRIQVVSKYGNNAILFSNKIWPFVHKLTSDSALMIFQSSRAYTGGVTALLVCCALPSVFT